MLRLIKGVCRPTVIHFLINVIAKLMYFIRLCFCNAFVAQNVYNGCTKIKWAGMCRYTASELLFVLEFHSSSHKITN
jgi:hypothetical protein